ncbi:Hypothetical predicted protein [Pelobates cultripes]|uniref:Uncharacterized protein n=1 Tax=Pelobates cultripes TaxID=61616 RepID=A0AAD1W8R0_PELCU|nr:Hypothetical predicted protein [Pelobates cultripes]
MSNIYLKNSLYRGRSLTATEDGCLVRQLSLPRDRNPPPSATSAGKRPAKQATQPSQTQARSPPCEEERKNRRRPPQWHPYSARGARQIRHLAAQTWRALTRRLHTTGT